MMGCVVYGKGDHYQVVQDGDAYYCGGVLFEDLELAKERCDRLNGHVTTIIEKERKSGLRYND